MSRTDYFPVGKKYTIPPNRICLTARIQSVWVWPKAEIKEALKNDQTNITLAFPVNPWLKQLVEDLRLKDHPLLEVYTSPIKNGSFTAKFGKFLPTGYAKESLDKNGHDRNPDVIFEDETRQRHIPVWELARGQKVKVYIKIDKMKFNGYEGHTSKIQRIYPFDGSDTESNTSNRSGVSDAPPVTNPLVDELSDDENPTPAPKAINPLANALSDSEDETPKKAPVKAPPKKAKKKLVESDSESEDDSPLEKDPDYVPPSDDSDGSSEYSEEPIINPLANALSDSEDEPPKKTTKKVTKKTAEEETPKKTTKKTKKVTDEETTKKAEEEPPKKTTKKAEEKPPKKTTKKTTEEKPSKKTAEEKPSKKTTKKAEEKPPKKTTKKTTEDKSLKKTKTVTDEEPLKKRKR